MYVSVSRSGHGRKEVMRHIYRVIGRHLDDEVRVGEYCYASGYCSANARCSTSLADTKWMVYGQPMMLREGP